MEKKTYSELLLDPRWQTKKAQIILRDNSTCQHCGCKTKTLHVHHKSYIDGRLPWEYNNDYLITLCNDCHNEEHSDKYGCSEAIIGHVYRYSHGEYENYMLCYDIDYSNGFVHLMGFDTGASIREIWYDIFTFSYFTKKCSIEEYLFNDVSEGIPCFLLYMIKSVINNSLSDFKIYYDNKKDGIKDEYRQRLIYNIDKISINNKVLGELIINFNNK